MFSTTLDTKAVKSALVKHLSDVLGIQTEGKDFDVTVVVGRKSAEKPVPDITATVDIYEAGERTVEVAASTPAVEAPVVETTEPVVEDTVEAAEEVAETVVEPEPEVEPELDEEDVSMPPETKPWDAPSEDDADEKGEGGLFD